ncbi:MAG: ferredoxin-type protein NapG [Nitrospirae bacterium]|nr:ferredoxin-type protein NapG [Nitrospirota bacterium]
MNKDRRHFLTSLGFTAVGGILWGRAVFETQVSALVLRPPGAIAEKDFIARCIRCGQCVETCPFSTLVLAAAGDNKPPGMPFYTPRKLPCYMCRDIPCVPVCPTHALDRALVSEGDRLNINKARMGLAVLDRETCVAYWGLQCDACYRVCPLIDKAIKVQYSRNERTGKHAFMAPVVDSEHCTGCGLCEHACINDKASIFVLPRELATGKANVRYLRGWYEGDEGKLRQLPKDTGVATPRSKGSAVDYLNKGVD